MRHRASARKARRETTARMAWLVLWCEAESAMGFGIVVHKMVVWSPGWMERSSGWCIASWLGQIKASLADWVVVVEEG
jgi:hypothetical protein